MLALSRAEWALEFEHRDSHWGNVLVQTGASHVKKSVVQLEGQSYEVVFEDQGYVATIIDFTLSRIKKGSTVHFTPIDHPDYYQQPLVDKKKKQVKRDAAGQPLYSDAQYRVKGEQKAQTHRDWSIYKPRTNVFWLIYLLDKISSKAKKLAGAPKQEKVELQGLADRALACGSVTEVLKGSLSAGMDICSWVATLEC
ncbi:Serine/threonine-protein kinase haspin [Rhizophlyctis rosea]|nr:Serine/threonine-protein kinase haspin [Rhizophlyctis rosea]